METAKIFLLGILLIQQVYSQCEPLFQKIPWYLWNHAAKPRRHSKSLNKQHNSLFKVLSVGHMSLKLGNAELSTH